MSAVTSPATNTNVTPRRYISAGNVHSDLQTSPNIKNIGTHDGTFHCDELLAISMLRLLPLFQDSPVVRTRDLSKLAQCAIIVDVGAEYDPERQRFDHHQRGFTHTMEGYTTKLSSAGLIYKHFGLQVIRQIAGSSIPEHVLGKLYRKTYEDFIQHIDGIDNGISVCQDPDTINYKVETHLPARVARLNPAWNEEDTPDQLNTRFSKGLDMVSKEFIDFVTALCDSWWPARQLVEEAWHRRLQYDKSGELVVLTRYCPWIAHLFDLEEEEGAGGATKYVLYQDNKGAWRIHAVPEKVGSFISRLPLPEKWCGLRDNALSEAIAIPGCIFVHANGFIGGNETLEGALKMARGALAMSRDPATC